MAKETTPRADELKALGWSTDEVSRYAELWDYRQRWGAINLERDDRLFLRKAESALPKIVSGKAPARKDLKEKSYYRWLSFYLESMNQAEKLFEIPIGARGIWPILVEEELRILEYYQPVLGLPDTLKAKGLFSVRESIIETAKSNYAEVLLLKNFDFAAPLEELKAKESTKWLPLRNEDSIDDKSYPVLTSDSVQDFRIEVWAKLIDYIPTTLPSLSDTDKPKPPVDWSP